jgi:anti-sigma28 factor (negative regulator of flagellin synthesis)
MKINETTAVADVGRVVPPEPPTSQPKDRVTVSKSRDLVDRAVDTAKAAADGSRPGRLKELEARVRAGEYHPDPSRVAQEILQDAEVDARLQSVLQH